MSAPKLPEYLSPDGREVWGWAGAMANHIHKQAEIGELQAKIRKSGTECGDCAMWMTRQCPREVGNRGPSMSAPACERFIYNSQSVELRNQWLKELEKLMNEK